MTNKKERFTPGPWGVHDNIGRKGEMGIVSDGAPCIIAIMGNQKAWPLKASANARLIAAAPDMLAVCEEMVHGDGTVESLQRALDLANIAIKKALGE